MLVQCAKCGKHLTTAQLSPGSQGPQCVYCGATVPVFDQNTLVTQGQPAPVPSAAPPDLQIEGYEILGRLGEGGMGIVYLGRQVSLDRKVAIKVLSPGLLQDPSFLVRFDREIAALVRLSHPHIVTIFDRGQSAAGHVYYIMEYVEGESGGAPLDLERLIAEGRLDSQRTRELMLQVVQALGFAHREGIIHRDVKPTNILIDRHGFAKVADFGIACMRADFAARQVTMANASVGTAMYMSPEQQRDAASVDHRSDIYGAGIMLYQMLTSQLPLAGYAPPSIAVPGLSRQWDAIVAKAVQPRPENRFADMAELEVALRSLGATVVAQPLPVPTFPPVAPQKTAGGSVPTVCPQCGSQASDADQFCVTCGISLWTDCRQCAQKVFAAARFCPGCRADVENQRVFDDYLQLGRDWLEQARPGPPSTNCVRQLEQARLALVKALTCIDSADARSLVDEGNRLSSNFAWQAGEVAAQAKRLDEATYCYEQVLEASPGQGVATACLEKLRSYRGDLIKKAQRLFAEGQQKKAVTLLRTGVEQFENDDELLALLTQYHENSAQLRQLRDQIPALAEQHRWCEIMQILAELEQSGIPMKGFDEDAARAQQKLAAVEPLIAAATSSLEHGDPTQALALAERVLQEVADHAEAVEITKLARRRAASRRRSRRFAAVVFGVACLALIGGVGYVCVREALAIDEAERQIKGGQYATASQTLNALPHRFFHKQQVAYLQAEAKFKEYASSKEIPEDALLQASKKEFLDLFNASEGLRMQARLDLADTIDRVPADAPDALARSLATAKTLKELLVADSVPLAAGLVTKAQKRSQAGRPALEATDSAYVLQVLEWDPGAAEKVVALALPERQPLEPGLEAIRVWAAKDTTRARSLAQAVLGLADWHAERNQYQQAGILLDTARQVDGKTDGWSFWKKHFQMQVNGKDASSALRILTLMAEQNPAKSRDVVSLYKDLAAKFSDQQLPPPPQILPYLRGSGFEEVIAKAEETIKAGQYPLALRLLNDAWQQYPDLYRGSEKAQKLYAEASFHVSLSKAQELLATGDLEASQEAVEEALKIRPNDAGAIALGNQIRRGLAEKLAKEGRKLLDAEAWDKAVEYLQNAVRSLPNDTNLLALFDEATTGQHHSKAMQAKKAGELENAVSELNGARRLLEKPSNQPWSVPLRKTVNTLAEEVTDILRKQAAELSGKRQYDEALEGLGSAERLADAFGLSSTDLAILRKQIEKVQADPKTANLSGRWRAPAGLQAPQGKLLAPDGMEFDFVDRGTDITVNAVTMSGQIRAATGQWRRDGARLVGTLNLVLRDGTNINVAAEANIREDSKTIAVDWKRIKVDDPKKKTYKLSDRADWTKGP